MLEVRLFDRLSSTDEFAKDWEKLVLESSASGFMQSLAWAEVKRRQGLEVLHIGVFESDKLIGGSIFYTPGRRNGAGLIVAPDGPVLPWHDEKLAKECLRIIIEQIKKIAKTMGIMTMRIEPRLRPPQPKIMREFGRAPIDLVPQNTLVVDLDQQAESQLAAMKPKGRYNIKLSERSQVKVFTDESDQAVHKFYAVLREAAGRDDFDLEPEIFFEKLGAVLLSTGNAKFLFAEHDGDIIGSLLLILYGERATYLYGGISNRKRNLMGGYAMQWSAMNIAREHGCKSYDLYGFDPFRAPENRYAKFSQFKSQFGGTAVRSIGAQDYFLLDNVADAFIKIVSETRILKTC